MMKGENEEFELMHIANAGFLIKYKGKHILIDGLHTQKQLVYETVHEELYEDMKMGRDPFGKIDILLFTHSHGDHFDPMATAEFLKESRETFVVATPGVVALLEKEKNYHEFRDRIITCKISNMTDTFIVTLMDIKIKAMRFAHQGECFTEIENFGYIIGFSDKKLLHLGDAEVNETNFQNRSLLEEKIDVALLNFPFLTLKIGQLIIDKYISPVEIGYMHFPNANHDKYGWIKQAEVKLARNMEGAEKYTIYKESMAAIYKKLRRC